MSGVMFEIVEQKETYKRYLTLQNRTVKFPNGKIIEWDVVGHSTKHLPNFVVVFPFDLKTKTTTLIQEYCQGTNELLYTFASGGFDYGKHKTLEDCIRAEMSEEVNLKGGEIVNLLPEGHEGISEVKWCVNKFWPVLVIDPKIDHNPLPKDYEEYIIVHRNVSLERLEELILEGKLLLPSVQTAYIGIKKLKELGFIQ
jgi:hypothetical protein